jgi:negative regulator of flagellin synthesis FlgM
MKVSGKTSGVGPTPSVVGGSPSGGAQPAAAPASAAVNGDALSVSSTAQFMAAARAQLARIPDIRTDKVEAIKAQLDSDAYNPDGDAVADGLVREHTPPATADGVS